MRGKGRREGRKGGTEGDGKEKVSGKGRRERREGEREERTEGGRGGG